MCRELLDLTGTRHRTPRRTSSASHVVAVGAALAQAPRLPSGLRQVPQSRIEVQPLQDGLQDEGTGDTTMRPPGADGEHDHAIGVVMHGILDIIHN